jgi:hypothetical protein
MFKAHHNMDYFLEQAVASAFDRFSKKELYFIKRQLPLMEKR